MSNKKPPTPTGKPKLSPKPKVAAKPSTPQVQFNARMEKELAKYVAEALEDWSMDYPHENPDTSESWQEEKQCVIEEFEGTTLKNAKAAHLKLMAAMQTAALGSSSTSPTKPKPAIKPKTARPPVVSPKPKPTPAAKKPASPPLKPQPRAKSITTKSITTNAVDDGADNTNDEEVVVVQDKDVTLSEDEVPPVATTDATVTIPYKQLQPKPLKALATRGAPLTLQQWESWFDSEGRMVTESEFKKIVFLGGIEPEARRAVLPFLVGVYSCSSTTREREIVLLERQIEYAALKERWMEELQSEAEAEGVTDMTLPSEDLDDMHQFMFIQAKVNAMRYMIDKDEAMKNIKIISKDVPRTDRKGGYFCDDTPHRLQWLNDILVTYAIFHQTVGYAQGMNDVLSMILAVMDNEADAYWCFKLYMDTIQSDFMTQGMMDKLESLVDVVKFMDPEFYRHLELIDGADMVFCHRWLLLSFKREFSFSDATRLFEILCSHHLELSSIEAEKERAKENRRDKKKPRPSESQWEASEDVVERLSGEDEKYTFELFVCLAVLRLNRVELMATKDVSDVFAFINGLVCTMDLNEVLLLAEEIFFDYCRKSVSSIRVEEEVEAVKKKKK